MEGDELMAMNTEIDDVSSVLTGIHNASLIDNSSSSSVVARVHNGSLIDNAYSIDCRCFGV